MPDLDAILTLYRLRAAGAAPGEGAPVSDTAMDRVSISFLSREESGDWGRLAEGARAARTRIGQQRFRRWEMANPDIASVLQRKARSLALG